MLVVYSSKSDARVGFSSKECWWSTANQMLLTAMVGGRGALRAAVLFTVGGGEVGLGGATPEAHLGAPRRHLRHALLGFKGLGPDERDTHVKSKEHRERSLFLLQFINATIYASYLFDKMIELVE